MRVHSASLLLLLSLAFGGWGCARASAPAEPQAASAASQAPAGGPPTGADKANEPKTEAVVVLMPPGREPIRVRVELAQTPAERQRGLMFRKQLDPDAGMLFLFDNMQQLSFWMRNTYLPLDMLFIRDDLTVLGIVENAEPMTDTSRRVPGLSQYVLEVNAGFSREHGLVADMPVRFEGVEGVKAAQ